LVEILIPVLSGLCCLSGLVLLVVGLLVMRRRKKGGGSSGGGAEDTATAVEQAPQSLSPIGAPHSAASARLDDPPTRPTERGPSGIVGGGDEVEDYDDDAPTTLIDPVHLGIPPMSSQNRNHNLADERPPPLPSSYAGEPPSHRRAKLDHLNLPDMSTLEPGATIIPPEDWADSPDYIDDEEADETMLMARPPLPPKK